MPNTFIVLVLSGAVRMVLSASLSVYDYTVCLSAAPLWAPSPPKSSYSVLFLCLVLRLEAFSYHVCRLNLTYLLYKPPKDHPL